MNLFCRSLITVVLFAAYMDTLSANIDRLRRAKLNRITKEQRALSQARWKALSETTAKNKALNQISEVRDNNGELISLMTRTSRDKNENVDQFLYRVIFNLANLDKLEVAK